MTPLKPGWQTTEFWLTILLHFLNGMIQSGAIESTQVVKMVAFSAATLTTIVYALGRAKVKAAKSEPLNGQLLEVETKVSSEAGFARLQTMLLIATLGAMIACGASVRTKVLRVNLAALNAASETMLSVSKEREDQIVARATSKEQGHAELDGWRSKVDVVAKALDVAFRAVFSASVLNDARSLSDADEAVAKALAQTKELKQ